MARQAALRRLADTLLGGTLDSYVTERREAGKSWRMISLDLHDDIAVDISHETLRQWYGVETVRPLSG